MHPGYEEDPGVAPTNSPTSDDAAREIATAALATYLTPASKQDWYLAIEPYLSPDSLADFAAIDPAPLPTGTVTGAPELAGSVTPYLATVRLDTTAGRFAVLLQRLDETAAWTVVKIQREAQ